jgi:Ca2+:H+ antiporter
VIRRLLAPSFILPLAACIVLAAVWGRPLGWVLISLVSSALMAAVFVGVHHAEVVAHRVGEPFGTLVLAMAVTVIELALIGSMMLSGSPSADTLARDTVYATVMIVCNGVVGLCLLMGAIRHHVMIFQVEGAGQALAVLAPLTTLTLVLPTFTTTAPGAHYAPSQLAFAGVASLVLYGAFVFVQTVRHRDYFLPVKTGDREERAPRPSVSATLASLALLFVCLVAVVGLAKLLAPSIEAGVRAANAPQAVVGICIALLVLLPETWAALRAATRNQMQTEPQSRARLGARDDRADDPRGRRAVDLDRAAADARVGRNRHDAARADAACIGDHAGDRPRDRARRNRAPDPLRRVPVPLCRPLTT